MGLFLKIRVKHSKKKITFFIDVEEEDNLNPSPKVSLSKRNFSFKLPKGLSSKNIHPDHLALISILVCHPFIGKRIEFPKPISKKFFEATNVISRYVVENIDEDLEPWAPLADSRPALAFSGGADSTAALALMPENTVPVFLDRPLPLFRISKYDKNAPHVACEKLSELGYDVYKIKADLEYVRKPVGFPVDVANAAPAIILANHMQFDAIAFGTIMESAFGVGHPNYRNYPKGSHYRMWGTLFAAAGLPLLQVVSGVSEVGTSIINRDSSFGHIAHSCMRGKWMNPCRNCWKCFRKLVLDSVANNKKISQKKLNELFKIREAKYHLSQFPIKHENVLIYSTSKYVELFELDIEGNESMMSLLTKRVRGDVLEVDWMEKYFPVMFDIIPEKYRDGLKIKLEKYLQPMTKKEQEIVLNWNLNTMLNDEYYQELNSSFCKKLNSH